MTPQNWYFRYLSIKNFVVGVEVGEAGKTRLNHNRKVPSLYIRDHSRIDHVYSAFQ